MDCNPPGSSVHGIFQARILEWIAILFSRGFSQPRDQTQVSHTAGRFFTVWATRKPISHTHTHTHTHIYTHIYFYGKFRVAWEDESRVLQTALTFTCISQIRRLVPSSWQEKPKLSPEVRELVYPATGPIVLGTFYTSQNCTDFLMWPICKVSP